MQLFLVNLHLPVSVASRRTSRRIVKLHRDLLRLGEENSHIYQIPQGLWGVLFPLLLPAKTTTTTTNDARGVVEFRTINQLSVSQCRRHAEPPTKRRENPHFRVRRLRCVELLRRHSIVSQSSLPDRTTTTEPISTNFVAKFMLPIKQTPKWSAKGDLNACVLHGK